MISDPIVRPIVTSNFITQVSTSHLLLALRLVVSKRCSMERSVKFVPQILKCLHLIRSLIPRVLTLCHNSTGYMYSSTRWISFIYMLTTSTLRPIRINSHLFHIQYKFSRYIRHYDYDRRARMKPACFFSLWHSLDLMYTRLMFKMFVDILPWNVKSRWFTTLADADVRLKLKLFQTETHQLAIVLVHLD